MHLLSALLLEMCLCVYEEAGMLHTARYTVHCETHHT
jgi:hypothetical protein